MRKQTKLVAVVSAAALVAIGASMTSFAATGWQQEDGLWYYYNTNGDYVVDEWKRSGDNYFYLGWDGYMVTNQLVQHGDNYYYVDANGAMVKNQWVAVAADDTEDQDVDHRWYYFGSTGRAYRSSNGFSKKTINGKKYAFDEEGKMLYGWVDEAGTEYNNEDNAPLYSTYFFGPNDTTTVNGVTYTGGAMVTGWYNYLDGIDIYEDEGDESLWLYFNTSTGKKEVSKEKRINGLYYHFDENGIMDSGWTRTASGSAATASKYYSGSDQGWKQRNTWVWAVPSADIDPEDNENDQYRWFYVDSTGKPTVDRARRINSKWYIFDQNGIMKSGLVVLTEEKISSDAKLNYGAAPEGKLDTENLEASDIKNLDTTNIYYFSGDEENDGAMKTGTNVRIDLADGTYTFGFAKNGKAYHGVNNKKLYDHGILLDGGDMRYDVATIDNPDDAAATWYVVGPTGTFASNNSTVKDADDNYYAVVGGYIFKVPADDYASRVARAIVSIGRGSVDPTDSTSYKVEGGNIEMKVGTDEWVTVAGELVGRSDKETVDLHFDEYLLP